MSKKIKVFIGGPTDLKDLHKKLRTVATDLSNLINENDDTGIICLAKYYGEFDTPQQTNINNYIEKDADIVVFILKDTLEGTTKKEYEIATKAYSVSKKRPQFFVFVDQGSKYLKEIEAIMAEPEKAYYITYANEEDLEAKVKSEIEKYIYKHYIEENKKVKAQIEEKYEKKIKDNIEEAEAQIKEEYEIKIGESKKTINALEETNKSLVLEGSKSRKKISFYRFVLLGLILPALILGLYYGFHHEPPQESTQGSLQEQETEPMMVFVGGGSVANFISSEELVDIKNYHNSIYINQPSGNAWSLLVEDMSVLMGGKKRRYIPICLSADGIDTTFIYQHVDTMRDEGRIVELKLGDDPLVVYVKDCKEIKDLWHYTHFPKKITAETLGTMLETVVYSIRMDSNQIDSKVPRLFTTSLNSGTLRSYDKAIPSLDFNKLFDEKIIQTYYDFSSSRYIESLIHGKNKPYIILGSQHYFVSELKKMKKLKIQDTQKGIYIYFVAKKGEGDNRWVIDKQIIQFLRKIKAEDYIDKKYWNQIDTSGYFLYNERKIINISNKN